VLDRYYQAALENQAEIVVRVTADCPLIDAQVIDSVIEALETRGLDFAAHRLPPPYKRTYPIGLDVEAATMQALTEAWQKAEKQHEREHVMPYLYDGSGEFKTFVVDAESDHGAQRWTVDTPEDLEFLRGMAALLNDRMDFTWQEILKLVQAHPELSAINADVRHKWMDEIDERTKKE
jgi:spore coat polysaccharide biosynthesis protein SpsF